ncbi:hypothetical protein, partial [Escherichia coli]
FLIDDIIQPSLFLIDDIIQPSLDFPPRSAGSEKKN